MNCYAVAMSEVTQELETMGNVTRDIQYRSTVNAKRWPRPEDFYGPVNHHCRGGSPTWRRIRRRSRGNEVKLARGEFDPSTLDWQRPDHRVEV